MSRRRSPSLKEQVMLARKAYRQWPKWMKETCRMEGTDVKERRL